MLLTLDDLSKSYFVNQARKTAFESVNLTIAEGEFVAIVGPSGCGKTSLLRVISGLEQATGGSIRFNGSGRPNIAMVFQEHGLFPWMTLKKNIEIALQNNSQIPAGDVPDIIQHYFAKIGLLDFLDYYPHQVSGGMRQRVNVARGFANQSQLLLMDEPFVFLDYQTRLSLQELLMQIWQESRQTVLFVTHDIEEALLLADRVVLMTASPGKIARIYPIELDRPREILQVRQQPTFNLLVSEIMQFLKAQQVQDNAL